jgi:large subunit ribosomal protein L21
VPKLDTSPSAVVVTGGKQYRVSPGDRLLVDRLAAEAGTEFSLDRVLLVADGDEFKLGEALQGSSVLARVLAHPRGPKLRVLRYKSKKRVRVHRGARADLTLLEIVEVAGRRVPEPEEQESEAKPAGRLRRLRRRTAVETEPEVEPESLEPVAAEAGEAAEPEPTAPARPRRRAPAKEAPGDGT